MQALKRAKVDHHPCMFTTTSKNALKYAVAGMSCSELIMLHIVQCIAYVAAIASDGSNCVTISNRTNCWDHALAAVFSTLRAITHHADVMHCGMKIKTQCQAVMPDITYHYAVLSPGIAYWLCFCSFSYQIEGVEGHLGPGDKAACIPAGLPNVPVTSLCSVFGYAHHQYSMHVFESLICCMQ